MSLPDDLGRSARVPPIIEDKKGIPLIKTPSIFNKEKESAYPQEEEFLKEIRAEIKMEIDKEVKEAGVKEVGETIKIPQGVIQKTGITEVGEGVPFPIKPTLKLPLDDQKIKKVTKTAKIIDSILWLAHWCLRQIKIARFKALKLVGAKVENI